MARLGSIDFDKQVYSKTEVNDLLDGKQDVLVFDDVPTEGSSNPVTSDGIRRAIDGSSPGSGLVLRWKGSVPDYDDLPSENVNPGDVYNIESDGMNVAATDVGSNDIVWDPLGPTMDLYLTKADASATYLSKNDADREYLPRGAAAETYISKTDASDTYLTKIAAGDAFDRLQGEIDAKVINDATLTIKKNGTTVATFSANASQDVVANIETGSQPSEQVQSDWAEDDSNDVSFIRNKPEIPPPQVQADWDEDDSNDVSFIRNKPKIPPSRIVSPNGDVSVRVTDGKEAILSYAMPALDENSTLSDLRQILGLPGTATLSDIRSELNLPGNATLQDARNAVSGITVDKELALVEDIVQADWAEDDSNDLSFIRNKPAIPTSEIMSANGNKATIGVDGRLTISVDGGGVPIVKEVATVDQISIKSVKENGAALTPDANGAVNVKGVYYATCDTATNTQAKVATLKNQNEVFVLEEGVVVYVKFTYLPAPNTNTLNVAGTGGKEIRIGDGPNRTLTSGSIYAWTSGCIVAFVYSGDYWIMQRPTVVGGGNAGIVDIGYYLDNYSHSLVPTMNLAHAVGTSIAPLWVKNASTSYSTGDLVMYRDGKLYEAKQDIAANTDWNASNWQAVTVFDELGNVSAALDAILGN